MCRGVYRQYKNLRSSVNRPKASNNTAIAEKIYNKSREMLLARIVFVVRWSAATVILLIGLNPRGLPIRSSLLGGYVAYLPHRGKLHAFCTMLSFSAFHVVGDANIDQFVALIALILVCVSFLSHNTNTGLLSSTEVLRFHLPRLKAGASPVTE